MWQPGVTTTELDTLSCDSLTPEPMKDAAVFAAQGSAVVVRELTLVNSPFSFRSFFAFIQPSPLSSFFPRLSLALSFSSFFRYLHYSLIFFIFRSHLHQACVHRVHLSTFVFTRVSSLSASVPHLFSFHLLLFVQSLSLIHI